MAAKYRKFNPRFWDDEEVMKLDPYNKLIASYCFTNRETNRVGIYPFSAALASDKTGIPMPEFAKRFTEVVEIMDWKFDLSARVLYLPTWWKHNPPENISHFKGCLSDLSDVPNTPLLREFAKNKSYLSNEYKDLLTRVIHVYLASNSSRTHQKQEQKQKQKQKQEQKKELSPGEQAQLDLWIEKFPEFWAVVHPKRRLEKRKTEQVWKALCPPQERLQDLLSGIVVAAAAYYSSNEPKYLLYPHRYLERRRWEDEANNARTDVHERNTLESAGDRYAADRERERRQAAKLGAD